MVGRFPEAFSAIVNTVGSTIAREADGGIYLHAGPEIGVASTKAYTSQCVVMALLALYFGRTRHLSFEAGLRIIDELTALPGHVEEALDTNNEARRIAAYAVPVSPDATGVLRKYALLVSSASEGAVTTG